MQQFNTDILVIGSGPAGLSAANSAISQGATVIIVERERSLGGILKQCIHDGFGLVRYGQKLTGPEYAQRDIDVLIHSSATILLSTFVTSIVKSEHGFIAEFVNRQGAGNIRANKIIFATGCRERTSKQILIQGTNPSGVMTAGTAQHYINLQGLMPTKRCVILGSGDIGLIMARRLTLEGAKVVGVYEIKATPSGLTRNVVQCLNDYGIPLYLSHTVTRVFGADRLTAVEICRVDEHMKVIPDTAEIIECDALILSVGLIPETEMHNQLSLPIDKNTSGAIVDQHFMTLMDNCYSVGNATHVNDLVDYVSQSGEIAGKHASCSCQPRFFVRPKLNGELAYFIPQVIDVSSSDKDIVCYFRSKRDIKRAVITVKDKDKIVYTKRLNNVKPTEMQRILVDISKLDNTSIVSVELEEICEN
ncbi:MAG: FAD-dependent oxidoreductase [Clostridia bacterium]|nr:FAD-dependent oxidoreductase [Clostridia bacterium]